MSNPNFPQDKLLDVFLDILKTNPYKAEYHKFMISRFGENEETTAIKNYFGYTDFDHPRITYYKNKHLFPLIKFHTDKTAVIVKNYGCFYKRNS